MEILTVDEKYAEQIEQFCEDNSIDFSIKNAEEIILGTNYDKVQYELDSEPFNKVYEYYHKLLN